MQPRSNSAEPAGRRHRPQTLTVFAAAFVAGAVLAYGVNRVVDVHVVQIEPQVESEPIFVALRSLPQGMPITVWDVALKDWPKAMLPTTALKADASFEGLVLRHPIREGQPLLSVQLVRDGSLPTPGMAARQVNPQPASIVPGSAAVGPATAERFVPAQPAEPRTSTAAVAAPMPAVSEPPLATPEARPSGEPSVTPVASVAPVALPPVAASGLAATLPALGTDIDVPAAAPATVPAATVPAGTGPENAAVAESTSATVDGSVGTPVPVVQENGPRQDELPVEPPALTQDVRPLPAADLPTPVAAANDEPSFAVVEDFVPVAAAGGDAARTVPATTDAAPVPLMAPVPALPSTDLDRPLAGFGRPQTARVPETSASVLDRSHAPRPPAADQRMPKHHLVVPERIAMAVDASFTKQPVEPAVETAAAPTPQASQTIARKPATAPAGGSVAPRQPVTSPKSPAGRSVQQQHLQKQQQQQQQQRGLGAWLPQWSAGSSRR